MAPSGGAAHYPLGARLGPRLENHQGENADGNDAVDLNDTLSLDSNNAVPQADTGALRDFVERTFPLSDAPEAFRCLMGQGDTCKVVLTVIEE